MTAGVPEVQPVPEASWPLVAEFLARLDPGRPARKHLTDVYTHCGEGRGAVLAVAQAGHLAGIVELSRERMALGGEWRPAAAIEALSVIPGPGSASMIEQLLHRAIAWCTDQRLSLLLAETNLDRMLQRAGFTALPPCAMGQGAPAQLRRPERTLPLRAATARDLPRLAAAYEARSFALDGPREREATAWLQLAGHFAPTGPLHAYVCDGPNSDTPLGYVLFTVSGKEPAATITVHEWVDLAPEAFAALGGFFAGVRDKVAALILPLQPDRPMDELLDAGLQWQVIGWHQSAVRVIDPAMTALLGQSRPFFRAPDPRPSVQRLTPD